MQKKLIALAVASVLAAPLVAQAGVEVYGQARVSLDFNNNNSSVAGTEDSAISLASNRSRLGFRGDEDLGGGLRGMWQFEQGVAVDTGNWNDQKRPSYLGLSGTFGSVLGGYLHTPYRASTRALDPFSNTRGDHNAIIGSLNGFDGWNDENGVSNAIAYLSPDNHSGFRAALAYIMPSAAGDDDNLPMTTLQSDEDGYSLSATFTQAAFLITAGYESWNSLGAARNDVEAWKIGGSFGFMDATTLGFIWESLDMGGTTATNGDRDAWTVSLKHKMGDVGLMAAYAMADETGGVTDTGADHFSIGASYAMTKTTEAYALYSMVSNDANGRYSLDGVKGITGQDVSSFSVGINHTFSSK